MSEIKMNDKWRYSPAYENRREGVVEVAKLMANAAITAPKAGGMGGVECQIIYGEDDQNRIANKMEELAHWKKDQLWMKRFLTEAVMVREADAVLLIGNYHAFEPQGEGCGLCGGTERCGFILKRRKTKYHALVDIKEEDPAEREKKLLNGPLCGFLISDTGFATGSALLIAYRNFIDAQPLFSVGVAGVKMGYCSESPFIVGIVLAAKQKNPFADVVPDSHVLNEERMIQKTMSDLRGARHALWYDYRDWYPKGKEKKKARTKDEASNKEV